MPSSITRLPVVHHRDYQAPLRHGHRFPMGKFRRLAELLVEKRIVAADGFYAPVEAPAGWLMLAHDPAYVTAVLGATVDGAVERRIGFPVDAAIARRARLAASGTLLAARLALDAGIACNTAGGGHHAAFGHGAGFCVFNDVAVAAGVLLAEGLVGRIAVIDCDVHQGDGTAAIFAGDPRVLTVSVHADGNFPVRKVAGDLDIGLADETGDDDYLAALEVCLPAMIDGFRPDLVFYNAGVDVHGDDRLGRLALTDEGLRARDTFVLSHCARRGVAVASVIGGGYAEDMDTLARRHAIHHEVAAGIIARAEGW